MFNNFLQAVEPAIMHIGSGQFNIAQGIHFKGSIQCCIISDGTETPVGSNSIQSIVLFFRSGKCFCSMTGITTSYRSQVDFFSPVFGCGKIREGALGGGGGKAGNEALPASYLD